MALALLVAGQVPEPQPQPQPQGAPAPVPVVVTSAAPERVALSVYRDPDRNPDTSIDPRARDQSGYALVTETRTIAIPAGPATLRFEGVAGNIFAETAILAGLPDGTVERNLDADLLSPRTLYGRALGRRVIVRRTDPATGRVGEEQATIRSGPDGAGVLQLAGGVEALRCSGLPETIVQTGLPDGLVARPTLSVRTTSPRATTATVTLSYLAGGFDWQADYVVTMRPDGRADLFAWVTLASSDVTAFADAATSVIAGKPKRTPRSVPEFGRDDGALRLRCWPTDIAYGRAAPPPPPPPPPPEAPAPAVMQSFAVASDIVVTGARRMAKQEELGDLKLYRLPDAVTVAARSQKQVAMLTRDGIALETRYVGRVGGTATEVPRLTLATRNVAARGLGLPLPAGSVAVFESASRALLLGEGALEDRAVGEDVEITLGPSGDVTAAVDRLESTGGVAKYRLVITNAAPHAIDYEARIALGDGDRISAKARLGRRGDARTWSVTVPANGRMSLDYTIRSAP
jgi:hypothetical protein